jgi:hypothetical protein
VAASQLFHWRKTYVEGLLVVVGSSEQVVSASGLHESMERIKLLCTTYPGINHKRVYRLYSDANLAVMKRKNAKRPLLERMKLQIGQRVNEVWSMADSVVMHLI